MNSITPSHRATDGTRPIATTSHPNTPTHFFSSHYFRNFYIQPSQGVPRSLRTARSVTRQLQTQHTVTPTHICTTKNEVALKQHKRYPKFILLLDLKGAPPDKYGYIFGFTGRTAVRSGKGGGGMASENLPTLRLVRPFPSWPIGPDRVRTILTVRYSDTTGHLQNYHKMSLDKCKLCFSTLMWGLPAGGARLTHPFGLRHTGDNRPHNMMGSSSLIHNQKKTKCVPISPTSMTPQNPAPKSP